MKCKNCKYLGFLANQGIEYCTRDLLTENVPDYDNCFEPREEGVITSYTTESNSEFSPIKENNRFPIEKQVVKKFIQKCKKQINRSKNELNYYDLERIYKEMFGEDYER